MKISVKFVNLALLALIIWVGSYLFLISEKPVYIAVAPTPTVYLVPTDIPIPTPAVLSSDKLFQLVNEWRVQNGYQAYIKSGFDCSVALQRLPEVKINWSHQNFYAERFCPRSTTNGCTLGENLVKGFNSESESLIAWENSPEHLANLKASYTHSCIATEGDSAVQIFSYF